MSILSSNSALRESTVREWIKTYLPYLEEDADYELKDGPFIESGIEYPEKMTIFVKNKDVILVDCKGLEGENLPEYINFGSIVAGSFICSHSNFKSMRGFPKNIGGHFDCSFCPNITSLEHAPKIVDKDFAVVNCGKQFTEEEIRKGRHITGIVYC